MGDNERRITLFKRWDELNDKKEEVYGAKVSKMLDGLNVTY